MFAINWLFGLVFWVGYVLFGVTFCIYFLRAYSKKTYCYLRGEYEEHPNNTVEIVTKYGLAKPGDCALEIFCLFVFWPIPFVVCCVWLIFCGAADATLSFIKSMDKKLPKIKIEVEEDVERKES